MTDLLDGYILRDFSASRCRVSLSDSIFICTRTLWHCVVVNIIVFVCHVLYSSVIIQLSTLYLAFCEYWNDLACLSRVTGQRPNVSDSGGDTHDQQFRQDFALGV